MKSHDAKFESEAESAMMFKERVFYFKLAKNLEEEKEFDAMNVEAYLMITPRYLYCIDLDTYQWLVEPVPLSNLGYIQLSLTNTIGCIFKMKNAPA